MKTKRIKPRQTLAKKIAKLPLPIAAQLARHGRNLHPIEQAAEKYLDALDFTKQCRAHKEKENAEVGSTVCANLWEWLAVEIMGAVQTHDGDTLRTLASFVETYRRSNLDEDKTRLTLISMKQYNLQGGRKYTAKEVARWLKYPEATDLSRLRAIGKEINFPFAPDTVGRPRKTQTRKQSLKH